MFSAIRKILALPVDIVTLFVLQSVLLFIKFNSFIGFLTKSTVKNKSSF